MVLRYLVARTPNIAKRNFHSSALPFTWGQRITFSAHTIDFRHCAAGRHKGATNCEKDSAADACFAHCFVSGHGEVAPPPPPFGSQIASRPPPRGSQIATDPPLCCCRPAFASHLRNGALVCCAGWIGTSQGNGSIRQHISIRQGKSETMFGKKHLD